MRLVRIAAASVSVKVGAFEENLAVLQQVAAAAAAEGVALLCLPELCLSGYQLEDRVQWPEVAEMSWRCLQELARCAPETALWAGLPVDLDGLLYNGLALLWGGAVRGVVLKRFLPSYSVFYEGRNFTPWRGRSPAECRGVPAGDLLFRLPFGDLSAQICEDAWVWPQENLPLLLRAQVLANASASPFSLFKPEQRRRIMLDTADRMCCHYLFSNLVGLDSARLVFDGGALVATPDGLAAEGPLLHREPWRLVGAVVDLDDVVRRRSENTTWREAAAGAWARERVGAEVDLRAEGRARFLPAAAYPVPASGSFFLGDLASDPPRPPLEVALDQILDALVLGVRDYFQKAGAFRRILVALSGGRDSALALVAAARAAAALPGPEPEAEKIGATVAARYLAGPFSSAATARAARGLAEELGVPFAELSIAREFELVRASLAEIAGGGEPSPLALQNAQARIRGALMLGWANSVSGLILVTSNLSEVAVGYFTTGGDNQGGFSPLADVPKTLLALLLDRAGERWGLRSLAAIRALPPSAELAPDQTDEADLMPYAVLDDILFLYARRKLGPADLLRVLAGRHPGHDAARLRGWVARFLRLFRDSQWKREQSPVALKLLGLDLDPKTGFRFPVLQDLEEGLD